MTDQDSSASETLTGHQHLAKAIAEALRRGGFVDPDDGTVPMWLPGNAAPVWVHPLRMATSLAAALQPFLVDMQEAICTHCGRRGHTSAWCLAVDSDVPF